MPERRTRIYLGIRFPEVAVRRDGVIFGSVLVRQQDIDNGLLVAAFDMDFYMLPLPAHLTEPANEETWKSEPSIKPLKKIPELSRKLTLKVTFSQQQTNYIQRHHGSQEVKTYEEINHDRYAHLNRMKFRPLNAYGIAEKYLHYYPRCVKRKACNWIEKVNKKMKQLSKLRGRRKDSYTCVYEVYMKWQWCPFQFKCCTQSKPSSLTFPNIRTWKFCRKT